MKQHIFLKTVLAGLSITALVFAQGTASESRVREQQAKKMQAKKNPFSLQSKLGSEDKTEAVSDEEDTSGFKNSKGLSYKQDLFGSGAKNSFQQIPSAPKSVSLVGEEKNYIIGAGDILSAVIWTTTPVRLPIQVESSGRSLIPGVGSIMLNSRTLAQAQDTIHALLKRKYKNAAIDVFLETPKTVSVSVTGAAANPGEYTVYGTQRIADIIRLAGGLRSEGNPRVITVSNPSLNDTVIDLFQDLRVKGEVSPFIRSGDRIMIPASTDKITVTGAVAYPAEYDFKQGETLSQLCETAGGFQRGVDSSRILITRFIDEKDSVVRFEINTAQAKSFVLYRDDHIFVPLKKDYRLTREVTITGEVQFPGTYVVRDDKTRLIDIVGLAGGLTKEAFLPGSKISRRDFTDAGLSEYERLKVMNQSDLSPDEKGYLKYREGTVTGRVSIDFEDLLNNSQSLNNIIIRGGDEITIAKRGFSVNVMGSVLKPGLVDYKDGEDLAYYIERVGGYQKDAERRRIKIIKGGTETWLSPRHVNKIEVGDAIWIPNKPYVDRVQTIKEALTITGGIANIVIAAIAVLNFVQDSKGQ